MAGRTHVGWNWASGLAVGMTVVIAIAAPSSAEAQASAPAGEVTFTKDIAPILQRSCQNCHRPDGVAPMSLITYEEVRPWARAIKQRTGIGPKAGVMPPWYIEKNIGIQHYKDDPSLSDEEIATIAKWADSGAPRGNPGRHAAAAQLRRAAATWTHRQARSRRLDQRSARQGQRARLVGRDRERPDRTHRRSLRRRPSRSEKSTTSRETARGRATVGGRYVFHHMIWSTRVLSEVPDGRASSPPELVLGERRHVTPWPVHEVGRNPDFFDPSGRPAAQGRIRASSPTRSTCTRTAATPRRTSRSASSSIRRATSRRCGARPARSFGNGVDIDIKPMEAGQQLHAYTVLQEHTKITSFEPHLHAPGMRMCLEAIWGFNIQTLSCAGYDHNWVRGYDYARRLTRRCCRRARSCTSSATWTTRRRTRTSPIRATGRARATVRSRTCSSTSAWASSLTDEQFQAGDGEAAREDEADAERRRHRLPAVQLSRRG